MKVLHITNNYPTKTYPIFGIFVKEQISSLEKIDIKNEVFFINSRELGRKEYFFSLIRLIKHLALNKYDIIHCHHAFSAAIFILSGYSFFKKFIVSYQSDPKIEGGTKLFKLFLLFGGNIILKNRIVKYFAYKNVYYLPNGVDTQIFRPLDRNVCKEKLGLEKKKDFIIFLDSYDKRPYKRVDRFDLVLEILRDKYGLKNIEGLKLTNTDRNLIPLYFNSSILHLLTSDIEGSPNSVKESLACNIPIVSTDVGNVKEMISNIDGCYVSKTFDNLELASLAMKSLEAKQFDGRTAIIQKNLTIEKVAEQLKLIYNKILN